MKSYSGQHQVEVDLEDDKILILDIDVHAAYGPQKMFMTGLVCSAATFECFEKIHIINGFHPGLRKRRQLRLYFYENLILIHS